ncbi:hypothetical protein OG989_19445 [Micromonospora sp. NBC_01740]|uniref:hypothetical protein n=1 Tax=Micromonospora sp. NBC_01740 TaxID=2975986 RepID=UPI002E12D9F3|nr:hypothetical protein OG989_19445 [Micromonospora sp. NBC_01740]
MIQSEATLLDTDPAELADPHALAARLGVRAGTVRLGQTRIAVSSADPRAITYLHDLFTPANDIWEHLPDDFSPCALTAVNLAVSDACFARLVEHYAAQAVRRQAVHLHVAAPGIRYELADGTCAVVSEPDEIDGTNLVVQSPRGLVFVTTARPYAHLALARHLREFGYRRGESDGWAGLHASCAATPEGNVVVIGRSGAGKSTTALALAAASGCAFVANDRVMVRADGEQVTACGMPVPIRINGGTMHALGLKDATSWQLARRQPDFVTSDWQSFCGDSKLNLLPVEWRARTGTPLVPSVRLTAIVLPRVTKDSAVLSVRRVDPDQAREVLTEQLMTPDDDVFVEDWLHARTRDRDEIGTLAGRTFEALMRLPILVAELGTRNTLVNLSSSIREALGTLRA